MAGMFPQAGRVYNACSHYTELAYVDIKLLHPHHVGRTADGRRYIRINRKMSIVDTVFSVDTRFCLQSKGVSRIRQWVGSFMEAFGSDGVVVTVR